MRVSQRLPRSCKRPLSFLQTMKSFPANCLYTLQNSHLCLPLPQVCRFRSLPYRFKEGYSYFWIARGRAIWKRGDIVYALSALHIYFLSVLVTQTADTCSIENSRLRLIHTLRYEVTVAENRTTHWHRLAPSNTSDSSHHKVTVLGTKWQFSSQNDSSLVNSDASTTNIKDTDVKKRVYKQAPKPEKSVEMWRPPAQLCLLFLFLLYAPSFPQGLRYRRIPLLWIKVTN